MPVRPILIRGAWAGSGPPRPSRARLVPDLLISAPFAPDGDASIDVVRTAGQRERVRAEHGEEEEIGRRPMPRDGAWPRRDSRAARGRRPPAIDAEGTRRGPLPPRTVRRLSDSDVVPRTRRKGWIVDRDAGRGSPPPRGVVFPDRRVRRPGPRPRPGRPGRAAVRGRPVADGREELRPHALQRARPDQRRRTSRI